ncbi:MAG: hypothetical protein DRI86_08715 [Bacteroidetes bacterium]|nr:MAG: hypothetical protein DRI86_08715 [Bacteroidota bacterium]
MSTFTQIQKIKNNIKNMFKNNENSNLPEQPAKQEIAMVKQVEVPATKVSLPSANVSPAVVNMINNKQMELQNKGNDLGAYAMEICVAQNGSYIGFLNAMNIVVMNYKVDAELAKQELEIELVQEINNRNSKVIAITNEIAGIESIAIPEKEVELNRYNLEINSLMDNQENGISESLSNERLLIMQLAIARTNELIRKFKHKVILLNTEISQIKLTIDGLNMQKGSINFFNESSLRRRLNLFFNHWLIALEGLGMELTTIEETKDKFVEYLNQEIVKIAA